MYYYIDLVRFGIVFTLVLLGIILAKSRRGSQNIHIALLLITCIILYILSDWKVTKDLWVNDLFDLGGASIPFMFWIFSMTVFNDSFSLQKKHLLIYFLAILASFGTSLYISHLGPTPPETILIRLTENMHQYVSFIFIFMAMIEAFKGKKDDLLEPRIRFRNTFIIAVAILIGSTLFAEITLSKEQLGSWPSLVQKSTILLLIYAFASYILKLQPGFFFDIKQANTPLSTPDPALESALNQLINEEKVLLEEGLTIRALAERLNEKEYKIRRHINQHLGFKNFNDFLNAHRIQEACEILLDKKNATVTILEIAYQLGYSSIGPFNTAFKKNTGKTPTEYRKQ